MATILNTSLDAAEVTGPGAIVDVEATSYRQHTAITTVIGTVTSVTVDIEVSHDQANWAVAGTATFTEAGCEQVKVDASVRFLRAHLTELEGDPGAAVTTTISSG